MKVLSLDLSTHTGWAVLESNPQQASISLIGHGCCKAISCPKLYPYGYIFKAKELAEQIEQVYDAYLPDFIVVEDTNRGQQRYTQKFLEFIHFAVFDKFILNGWEKIYYISSSEWRSHQAVRLSKEQRSVNKKKIKPKVTLKHVAVQKTNSLFGLQLKQKDNDIADAILLGVAFLQGAKVSDGIIKKKGKQIDAN